MEISQPVSKCGCERKKKKKIGKHRWRETRNGKRQKRAEPRREKTMFNTKMTLEFLSSGISWDGLGLIFQSHVKTQSRREMTTHTYTLSYEALVWLRTHMEAFSGGEKMRNRVRSWISQWSQRCFATANKAWHLSEVCVSWRTRAGSIFTHLIIGYSVLVSMSGFMCEQCDTFKIHGYY